MRFEARPDVLVATKFFGGTRRMPIKNLLLWADCEMETIYNIRGWRFYPEDVQEAPIKPTLGFSPAQRRTFEAFLRQRRPDLFTSHPPLALASRSTQGAASTRIRPSRLRSVLWMLAALSILAFWAFLLVLLPTTDGRVWLLLVVLPVLVWFFARIAKRRLRLVVDVDGHELRIRDGPRGVRRTLDSLAMVPVEFPGEVAAGPVLNPVYWTLVDRSSGDEVWGAPWEQVDDGFARRLYAALAPRVRLEPGLRARTAEA